ncbi:hypothetical protein BYT27DRAFT_7237546 [Phlegmacium glaucopus]|nr:hypothetical protein BYT27DRAFT_7237546 [Phlegmacium glaucopus]
MYQKFHAKMLKFPAYQLGHSKILWGWGRQRYDLCLTLRERRGVSFMPIMTGRERRNKILAGIPIVGQLPTGLEKLRRMGVSSPAYGFVASDGEWYGMFVGIAGAEDQPGLLVVESEDEDNQEEAGISELEEVLREIEQGGDGGDELLPRLSEDDVALDMDEVLIEYNDREPDDTSSDEFDSEDNLD